MKPISQLIEEYAECCVEAMDMVALCEFAKETIEEDMTGLSEAHIIETINEYFPELLGDN